MPDEIKRREDRLAAIATAKAKIETRTQERFQREQAEYEAKLKEAETGKKSKGREPKVPDSTPRPLAF